jgi:hypothetical protein
MIIEFHKIGTLNPEGVSCFSEQIMPSLRDLKAAHDFL